MMKRDPSRFLQLGFLGLFFLCVLMVGYWITENLIYTRSMQEQAAALAADLSQAPAALAAIEAANDGRTNRYIWEGAFFLVVLIAGMSVLTRTLRHDVELRRRQQNFLAAVSHEFKSPLASMQLAAETLMLRADPDAQRLGQRILEDCERLLRMVDNLLDTTRIEEGQHRLSVEETNLAAAVQAVAESFEERAARHSVTISQNIAGPVVLAIDRTAFDTILRNLIDNAVKACVAADGHHVEVKIENARGRIELRVADDGLGFDPDDADRMFEKFHRLGDEIRRKTPGTGLGLYIVKKLVDLSGGTVGATSEGPGRGAEICVSWPAGAKA